MEFSFPAVLAWIFLQADNALIKQMLIVSLIHELGHGLAMCVTQAGVREIRFYAAGIQMKTNTCLLSTGQILGIYLSGPVLNLICAMLFRKVDILIAILHLSIGVFNLLPYRILDGGAALESLLETRPEVLQIRKIFCILLSAAIVLCLSLGKIQNPALYLMIIYLGISEILVDKLCFL